jgi:uncharacterized protein (TIGR00369 family)
VDDDLRASVLERLGPRPFVAHLGCELLAAEPGLVRMRLPWRAAHARSGLRPGESPSLHGGAAAALADIAASSALVTVLREGEGRTTVDLSIHYLAPLTGDVTAEARVRRRGGRTAVIDIELRSGGADEPGAIARATMAILPPRPAEH